MAQTFDQFVAEYEYYVESLLLGYGFPRTEFDDLKQEVWLRVHASEMLENHVEGWAKISSRLWSVVRSVAMGQRERARVKGRDKVVPWPRDLERRVGDGGAGAAEVVSHVLIADLEARLDPRSRRVFAMAREGFLASQIARTISVSEQTVRNTFRRIQAEAAL